MKNTLFASLGVVLLCSFCFVLGKKQAEPKVCFTFHTDDQLRVGIANRISILAEQEAPVSLEQVSISSQIFIDPENMGGDAGATITKDGSDFIVKVDKRSEIEIGVQTKHGIVKRRFPAKPIPAVPAFGKFFRGGTVSAIAFKESKGMVAWVECCDFDARCEMVEYSILRITRKNQVERAVNKGGPLNDTANQLIQAAKPGDLYWFRNIEYKCPGDEGTQYGEDISIEIK
jgi:GldM C-terminal domain